MSVQDLGGSSIFQTGILYCKKLIYRFYATQNNRAKAAWADGYSADKHRLSLHHRLDVVGVRVTPRSQRHRLRLFHAKIKIGQSFIYSIPFIIAKSEADAGSSDGNHLRWRF